MIDHSPQLIILDVSLPGGSGLDMCRELRTWYKAPILMLSGYGEEEIMVSALDLGADDYVTKPFRAGELLARVRMLLRRAAKQPVPGSVWKIGELELDRARRRLLRKGVEIPLTRTEFDILACLIENLDCVVTTKTILETVWGPHHGEYSQTLRVHIGHIRKKIEGDPSRPRYVLTEPGVGYRLSIPRATGSRPLRIQIRGWLSPSPSDHGFQGRETVLIPVCVGVVELGAFEPLVAPSDGDRNKRRRVYAPEEFHEN